MNKRLSTLCVQENKKSTPNHSHVVPIHATSAHTFSTIEDSMDVFNKKKDGYTYLRYGNPTISEVQNKIAGLASFGSNLDAQAFLTASGMGAIHGALSTLLNTGDVLVAQSNLYGGTTEFMNKFLKRMGIKLVQTNFTNLEQLEEVINTHGKCVLYLESPSNPDLKITDIASIVKLGQKYDCTTVMDNTFATPLIQRPLTLGIDIVVHSTTKYMNGHGNGLGGIIITADENLKSQLWENLKLMGLNSNAWDAWLIYNGLKTLPIRLERQCANAVILAEYLEAKIDVVKVNYPGLNSHPQHEVAKQQMSMYGAMISFDLGDDFDRTVRFINALKIISITSTLGNVDSLLLHPASSSHLNVSKEIRTAQGISDGLIRLSVGLEDIEDLKTDIDQAFEASIAR